MIDKEEKKALNNPPVEGRKASKKEKKKHS